MLIKHFKFMAVAFAGLALVGCNNAKYQYETVEGDPLNAKIYTLPNGLKVYMTVNTEQPRIQTYIAVRAGGKNDPAETTGLAHYFEHLMFKGSEQFGTMNYELEKPLLDEIQDLFEVYRKTTDPAERKAIYHKIDSVSYEASKYAIPNEYDKLMAAIGADGTNAYTSNDQTVYVDDIPSNQVENWARVQADRFRHNVIRGFHTELEAVYEEKNISLTKDSRKIITALFEKLFPSHPYGTQTVLGTQEQLKNPSIVNIKNFYNEWYVPNNIAICLSGDFNPDEMVDIITEYFGDWEPNPSLPTLDFAAEKPITSEIDTTVLGPEQEMLFLGWRLPGASNHDAEIGEVTSQLLSNGTAGLMDLNINAVHRALYAGTQIYTLADYSAYLAFGLPMPGQDLTDVKKLILDEIAKIRRGEFDEKMMEAVVNNYRLNEQEELQSNQTRADMFVEAFINHQEWSDACGKMDRIARLTKQDIVDFANKYLTDNSVVAVYKRQGIDPTIQVMEKPEITPILTNRDTTSAFVREIQAAKPAPISPVFTDYRKDLSILSAKQDIPVYYKKNDMNGLFELMYVYETGSLADSLLPLATEYLDYIGTDSMTHEQIAQEFYRLGCSYYIRVGEERTTVTLSGLNDNLVPAMQLMENLLAGAQANPETCMSLLQAFMQSRINQKSSQDANYRALCQYVQYGGMNLRGTIKNEDLLKIDPNTLVEKVKALAGLQHRILYYGPASDKEILSVINDNHNTAETLATPAAFEPLVPVITASNEVFLAPYAANNIYMRGFSTKSEDVFNADMEPIRNLYNEYFGGGMNSIVFQEIREARGLAYNAWSFMGSVGRKGRIQTQFWHIITQNDKMKDAVSAMYGILDEIPVSEPAFVIAKEGLLNRLRTQRTTRSAVLWSYISAQDKGLDYDLNRSIFENVQNLTLQDVVKYQQQNIKGRTYHIGILGDETQLDMKFLESCGNIHRLTPEQIFGY